MAKDPNPDMVPAALNQFLAAQLVVGTKYHFKFHGGSGLIGYLTAVGKENIIVWEDPVGERMVSLASIREVNAHIDKTEATVNEIVQLLLNCGASSNNQIARSIVDRIKAGRITYLPAELLK